ncbi:MAG: UvrB/UvrC motif-containing protein [Planctomycetes bacterium]|nr:UvrB/UvrC motif-containing protein [Planctomycetota bacterium]
MLCQNCQKNEAKVHVTDLQARAEDGAATASFQEQHFCDVCAQSMELPTMAAPKKSTQEIWKLLQMAAKETRNKKTGPACPDCGMTLDEFRKKGRLGCAKDYAVFKQHIVEILERVHGARRHVGRIPGGEALAPEPSTADAPTLDGKTSLVELRRELESAIREEAYERAAHLRDEIKALEGPQQG